MPRRDSEADNLLQAEQPVALDVARPAGRGQRDEGGKAKAAILFCSALDLWSYCSTGWPGNSPEGLGAPVAQGILSVWHSISQKQDKSV